MFDETRDAFSRTAGHRPYRPNSAWKKDGLDPPLLAANRVTALRVSKGLVAIPGKVGIV